MCCSVFCRPALSVSQHTRSAGELTVLLADVFIKALNNNCFIFLCFLICKGPHINQRGQGVFNVRQWLMILPKHQNLMQHVKLSWVPEIFSSSVMSCRPRPVLIHPTLITFTCSWLIWPSLCVYIHVLPANLLHYLVCLRSSVSLFLTFLSLDVAFDVAPWVLPWPTLGLFTLIGLILAFDSCLMFDCEFSFSLIHFGYEPAALPVAPASGSLHFI